MIQTIGVLLISFVYVLTISVHIKKEKGLIKKNLLNISALVFIIIYGIVFPLNYILSVHWNLNSPTNIQRYAEYDLLDFFVNYAAIFLVSQAFLIALKKRKDVVLYCENVNNFSENNTDKLHIKLTHFLFFVGLVANYFYLKAYGGYTNYLNYSKLLRAGISIVNNKYSFLFPFRSCIIFSSYLYATIFRKSKHKGFYGAFLIFSIFSSSRILYSNDGRLGIVVYILLLSVALFKKYDKNSFKIRDFRKLLILFIVGGILVTYIGVSLNRNDDVFFAYLLNKEITFAFQNFNIVRSNISYGNCRYFFDIFSFIIYLLPSSVWLKFNIKSASTINTIFWSGNVKGVNGVYGETPIDFISLSYMQFKFLGIIVLPIIFALLYYKLFNIVDKISDESIKLFLNYYILISIGIYSIVYSDPYLMIKLNFGFILFVVFYCFVLYLKKIKSVLGRG